MLDKHLRRILRSRLKTAAEKSLVVPIQVSGAEQGEIEKHTFKFNYPAFPQRRAAEGDAAVDLPRKDDLGGDGIQVKGEMPRLGPCANTTGMVQVPHRVAQTLKSFQIKLEFSSSATQNDDSAATMHSHSSFTKSLSRL